MINELLYKIRDIRSKALYLGIQKHVIGNVLDVGGGNFFTRLNKSTIEYSNWTTIEPNAKERADASLNWKLISADGCNLQFEDNSYDTILNIQVLEHVFEPIKMFSEMERVLKPNGKMLILIPQTSNLHMAPNHFGNFTRYWTIEAAKRFNLEIVEMTPMGGFWSSIASSCVYFFFHAFQFPGYFHVKEKRSFITLLAMPFMFLWAIITICFSLLFSLFDIPEEANNYFFVLKKA